MTDHEPRARHARHGALLFGLAVAVAGVILVLVYLRRFEAEVSGGERVAVISSSHDIAPGTPLTDEMLAVRYVPAAYIDDRVVRAKDRDRIIGIESAIPINAQNTLQWSDLAVRTDIRDLSQLIPPGKRAVTIPANRGSNQQNLMLRPGDYVDVLASTQVSTDAFHKEQATTVLLQRALVLAVGVSTDRKASAEQGSSQRADRVLTLSLDVDEAQLLALAMEQGPLSVIVRNPDDQKIREDLSDIQASSLIDARDKVRARRSQGRAELKLPVKLTEAK